MEQFFSSIPTGLEFDPTDEELVGDFLFKKVNNIPLSSLETSLVTDTDLYGEKEPWQLWEEFSHNVVFTNGDLFFFTKLKQRGKSSRYSRAVGKGTWHGENKGEAVEAEAMVDHGGADRKVLIQGMKKRFNYRNKDSAHHCRWIMHEYSMVNSSTNWVLCRLRNTYASDDNASVVNGEIIYKRKMMNSEAEQDRIKRLKITHETDLGSPQELNSDSKSINPESTSESIVAAEQNNGFLDLAVCGLITSQQPMLMHDQFTSQPVQTYADADDDFLMICYGSEGPPLTIDELFSSDQSFEQSDSSPDLQVLSDYLICEGWQNDMVSELFSNDQSFEQSDSSPDLQADYLICEGWPDS